MTKANTQLETTWISIDLIEPNPWNPNEQTEFIYDKTKESILQLGFKDTIKVRQLDNGKVQIIDGEHRWKVAQDLIPLIELRGKRYFYVLPPSGDHEKERIYPATKQLADGLIPITNYGVMGEAIARELTIVLNNTRGEPDELKLAEVIKEIDAMLGHDEVEKMLPYTGNELQDLMALLDGESGGVYEDDPPEVSEEEPITQMGDLWHLGKHRVLCADSTCAEDVERVMGGEKAAAIITDVPYGISQESNGLRRLDYGEWDHGDCLELAKKVLLIHKDVDTICAFCGDDQLSHLFDLFPERIKRAVGWVKPNPTVINGDHVLLPAIELAVYMKRDGAYFGGHCVRNVWEGTAVRQRDHTTQKPVALMGWLCELAVEPSALVIDPFLGSGTTLIAADQLDRVCYGLEIAPKYCDVIVQRYINYAGDSKEVWVERDGEKLSWEEVQEAKIPKIHVA